MTTKEFNDLRNAAYELGKDVASAQWTDDDVLIYAAESIDSKVDLAKIDPLEREHIIHEYNKGAALHYS